MENTEVIKQKFERFTEANIPKPEPVRINPLFAELLILKQKQVQQVQAEYASLVQRVFLESNLDPTKNWNISPDGVVTEAPTLPTKIG